MEVDDFFSQVEEATSCSCGILKKAEENYLFQYKPTKRGKGTYCFLFEMPEKIEPNSDGHLPPYIVFLQYIKSTFPEVYNNSIFINTMGCRPKGGIIDNATKSFTYCYQLNVLATLKKLKPLVIFPLGRALYSLTGDTFMPKGGAKSEAIDDFYKPLHDYQQLTKFYYKETDSVVFPLPKLLKISNNRYTKRFNKEQGRYETITEKVQILDRFETEFTRRQIMTASGTADIYKDKEYNEHGSRFGVEPPKLYRIKEKDVERSINKLIENDAPFLFLDTETSGATKSISLNPFACKLITIQVSLGTKKGFFFEYKKEHNHLWDKLFASKKVIIHNALFDLRVLRHHDMTLECYYDTMIGFHYGIDSNLKAGLKPLAYRYTFFGGYEDELDKWKDKYGCSDYGKIPKDILFEYATMDVIVEAIIFKAIYKKSLERSRELIMDVVMPFVNTVAHMQDNPFPFRPDVNRKIYKEFTDKTNELGEGLRKQLGNINLNSNDDVGRAFEELGLPEPSVGRNKKKLFKVGKEAILFWKNKGYDIAEKYQEYKGLQKLRDTFVGEEISTQKKSKGFATGIWQYVYNNSIMSNYMLGVVRSLRISCTAMNLQNIPKHGKYAKEVRKQFGLPEGWSFAELDFSGFQLRIMAILSGDDNMRKIFCSDNDDLHLMTAIKLGILSKELPSDTTFEECAIALEDKTHIMHKLIKGLRKRAKGINFGYIFSLASRTFARDDKNFNVQSLEAMTDEEIISEFKLYSGNKYLLENGRVPTIEELRLAMSDLFRNAFFESYPKIVSYSKKVQKQAIETGYVESVLGGRRYLEPLHFEHLVDNRNGEVKEFKGRFSTKTDCDGERVANLLAIAINSPIQAFESHIIMKAMNGIFKFIKENSLRTKMVGQIHDAVIVMFPPEEKKHLRDFQDIMEQDYPMYKNIPIKTDCTIGDTFGFKGEEEE